MPRPPPMSPTKPPIKPTAGTTISPSVCQSMPINEYLQESCFRHLKLRDRASYASAAASTTAAHVEPVAKPYPHIRARDTGQSSDGRRPSFSLDRCPHSNLHCYRHHGTPDYRYPDTGNLEARPSARARKQTDALKLSSKRLRWKYEPTRLGQIVILHILDPNSRHPHRHCVAHEVLNKVQSAVKNDMHQILHGLCI